MQERSDNGFYDKLLNNSEIAELYQELGDQRIHRVIGYRSSAIVLSLVVLYVFLLYLLPIGVMQCHSLVINFLITATV